MSNCTSAVESFSSIENNAVKNTNDSSATFSSSAGESMHLHGTIKENIQSTAQSHLPELEFENQPATIHELGEAKKQNLSKDAEPKQGEANEKCFELDKFETEKSKQSEAKQPDERKHEYKLEPDNKMGQPDGLEKLPKDNDDKMQPKCGGDKLEEHLLKQN
ncbi:MAG: hypothetical protein KGS72_22365 [Cyanobacteria bacterium REEB67]|nr:hypothetical protein [Cyanobacteria bacterium REEB67]